MRKYHYIVDTKIWAYTLYQTGQPLSGIFNRLADRLSTYPKGRIYMVFDKGKSAHRLAISSIYKGSRAKAKAKYDEAKKAEEAQFQEDYLALIELCETLPVTTIAIADVEADDIGSILAYRLAKDKNNRIGLLTNDRDWLASTIDDTNVKLILAKAAKTGESELGADYTRSTYNVSNREEFTLKKALEGDSGDNILTHLQLGTARSAKVWQAVLDRDDPPSLATVRHELVKFRQRFRYVKPRDEYREIGSYNTRQMLDINYRLAETMIDPSELDEEQAQQYLALEGTAPSTTAQAGFEGRMAIALGSFTKMSDLAKRVFRVHD